jgi:hypothetical protein
MGKFGKFVSGLGVGVSIGLLIAPEKGEETRRLIMERIIVWSKGITSRSDQHFSIDSQPSQIMSFPAKPVQTAIEPLLQFPAEPLSQAPIEPLVQFPAEPLPQASTEPVVQVSSEPLNQAPAEPLAQVSTEPQPQTTTESLESESSDDSPIQPSVPKTTNSPRTNARSTSGKQNINGGGSTRATTNARPDRHKASPYGREKRRDRSDKS